MDWTAILAPVVVEHVAPLVLTVAGGVAAVVVAKVGGVLKRKLDVDIDAQLSAMLRAAIERTVAALVARGMSRNAIVPTAMTMLEKSNPDAIARFGLDRDPNLLAELVRRVVDAATPLHNQQGLSARLKQREEIIP